MQTASIRPAFAFTGGFPILYARRTLSNSAGGRQGAIQGVQVTDLLDVYRGLVAQGRLKLDEDQVRVVMELRRLQKRLINYVPPGYIPHANVTYNKDSKETKLEAGQLGSEFRSLVLKNHVDEIAKLETPKGIFLTGNPGSGKSMLVDLWFSIIPTPFKARKHYSTLIHELYRAVWDETRRRQALLSSCSKSTPPTSWNNTIRDRWRSLLVSGASLSLSKPNETYDTIPMPTISYVIARRLLLSHWLLVFDEIQLLDVSSAGLLSDVLSWFWRMGGVVVGTSNKVPDDLYRNGVQQERLEPFVEALKLRCPVVHLRGTADYRKINSSSGQDKTWFTFKQAKEFEAVVHQLGQGVKVRANNADNVEVYGRILAIREISPTTCEFTFGELCDNSFGAADYISIASRYSTVVLTGIPIIRLNIKDQARRFITLIDALYESRCRLVCIAESDIDSLFFPENTNGSFNDSNEAVMMVESVSEIRESFRPNVSSYDSWLPSETPELKPLSLESLSIFSGEEERFAYQRAYSRLLEMTSLSYKEENEWRPLNQDSRIWESSTRGKGEAAERRPGDGNSDFPDMPLYMQTDRERPPPPMFNEGHIWGVREDWGPKAKAWGKGAAIYTTPCEGSNRKQR